MKACVVFDTRYGNTERVAGSLETGLKEAGIETVCVNAKDVVVESLKQYDLICVGGPTEAFSASKPIKESLGKQEALTYLASMGSRSIQSWIGVSLAAQRSSSRRN